MEQLHRAGTMGPTTRNRPAWRTFTMKTLRDLFEALMKWMLLNARL